MTLCDAGHDEVCYEVRNCPVCEVQSALDAALGRIEELEEEAKERDE